MSGIGSSLSKAEDGTGLVNRAALQQLAGVPKHLTRAEFDAAVAAERLRITNNGAGIYQPDEAFTIAGEIGVRRWTVGSGGSNAANAAASHARTVELPGGLRVTLAGDANAVRATSGAPTTGGASGDVWTDYPAGVYYTQTGASAWSAATTLSPPLSAVSAAAAAHAAATSNPHGVTKAQVGLGNVDNTADAAKPVSAPVALALGTKAPAFGHLDFADGKLRGMGFREIGTTAPNAQYFERFRRTGANIARIFLRPAYANNAYDLQAGEWTSLDTIVATLEDMGVRPIFTCAPTSSGHPDERADSNFWSSTVRKAALGAFWTAVATRYLARRSIVMAPINEPHDPTTFATDRQAAADGIRTAQDAWIASIRAVDPARTCLMASSWHGSAAGFLYLKPSAYDNVAYEAHLYAPFNVTHSRIGGQAAYTGTYPGSAAVAGGLPIFDALPANIDRIRYELQPVLAFRRRFNAVAFIGEFSCSRLTPGYTAPRYVGDVVQVCGEQGLSWSYHDDGYGPDPWNPRDLVNSSQTIDYDDGTTNSTATPLTIAAATGISDRHSLCPMVPLANAFSKNAYYRTASQPRLPTYFAGEDFELPDGQRPWTTTVRRLIGDGAAMDLASTANAQMSGQHARFTLGSSGSSQSRLALNDDGHARAAQNECWLSFDVCLSAVPTTGQDLALVVVLQDGAGNGCFLALNNVTGTNTWVIQSWNGSGDYSQRPLTVIDGMTFAAGVKSSLKLHWLCDSQVSQVQVWQGPNKASLKLLADINDIAIVTDSAVDKLHLPYVGPSGNVPGLVVDIDNIVFTEGADL